MSPYFWQVHIGIWFAGPENLSCLTTCWDHFPSSSFRIKRNRKHHGVCPTTLKPFNHSRLIYAKRVSVADPLLETLRTLFCLLLPSRWTEQSTGESFRQTR